MVVKTERKKKKEPQPDARKHSFYFRVLDEAEQLDFELAEGVEGIDEEITLLRVKIKSLLDNEPENIVAILKMAETIARLVKIKYQMDGKNKKGLKEAIGNVLREVALPLGIGIGTAINKKV